ncbi:MAG: asparagine synthase, partial [Gemmatimonadetes bacterium]|nr:asparagine synthase [Gemmatimonadota bacterium]
EIAAESLMWPLQFMTVRVSSTGNATTVTMHSGSWGTAPLFVSMNNGTLRGHWDARRLFPTLRSRKLNDTLVASELAGFGTPYSTRSVISDIRMLTERSTATWRSSSTGATRFSIAYPRAMPTQHPRRLRTDADVTATFQAILESSMRRWLATGADVVSELSGGLDSAIVTGIAARIAGRGWNTCAINLLDSIECGQVARRGEMVRQWNCTDHTVQLEDALPFGAAGSRADDALVLPWEECYYEAVDALLQRVTRKAPVVMMTGFGGDELCTLLSTELPRPKKQPRGSAPEVAAGLPRFLSKRSRDAILDGEVESAPVGHTAESSVDCAAKGSALYMRRGAWPVHPLCTPELVRFCASLPKEWRIDRTIERRVLQALGCSRRVTHGPSDSFSSAFILAVRSTARPLFEQLFTDSRLAAAGHVDGARLRREYKRWADGPGVEDGDSDGAFPFYSAAMLELTLRALERT